MENVCGTMINSAVLFFNKNSTMIYSLNIVIFITFPFNVKALKTLEVTPDKIPYLLFLANCFPKKAATDNIQREGESDKQLFFVFLKR
jgi:hypothetical protein